MNGIFTFLRDKFVDRVSLTKEGFLLRDKYIAGISFFKHVLIVMGGMMEHWIADRI